MLLREDDYVAFLYPTVDDLPANATQKDSSGNAYVFLRSNSRAPETNLVPIAADLSLATHTLRVVADRGWDRWAIAGYAVSSGDLALPYDRQILLGVIATCLSVLACVHSVASAPWGEWLPSVTIVISGLSAAMHLLLAGITSVFMMLTMLWTLDSPRPSILMRDEVNILLALLTGGALYLSPSLMISLIIAFALFLLVYHRLESGLILTLFWAPFFLFPVELHTFAFPMVEVMILITAAAGFVRLMVALGKELQMSNSGYPRYLRESLASVRAMDLAVGGIALLAVVSLLWTQHLETALTELRTLIIEPVLFYILLRATRPNKYTLLRLFTSLLVAGVLVALYGLYLYFIAEAGATRLDSVYGSANNVGLLFGRTIPIAFAFLVSGIDRRFRRLAAASLVIVVPALLLTKSVGAILLGIPAGLIVVAITRFQRKAIAPLLGASISR